MRTLLTVSSEPETERGLHIFFHHFANVSGERDISLAGITRRFDVQHFATGRRVSQTGNHTGVAGLELCFANIFRRAKHFRYEFRRDRYVLGFSARDLRCNSAADGCDLSLELAHAGFVRVIVDDVAERFLLPLDLLGLESVFLPL